MYLSVCATARSESTILHGLQGDPRDYAMLIEETYLGLDPVFIVDLGQILDTIVSKDGYNDAARFGSLGQLHSCVQVQARRSAN